MKIVGRQSNRKKKKRVGAGRDVSRKMGQNSGGVDRESPVKQKEDTEGGPKGLQDGNHPEKGKSRVGHLSNQQGKRKKGEHVRIGKNGRWNKSSYLGAPCSQSRKPEKKILRARTQRSKAQREKGFIRKPGEFLDEMRGGCGSQRKRRGVNNQVATNRTDALDNAGIKKVSGS